MAIHPLSSDSETNACEDLTADDIGDISLWIWHQKEYRNVPNYVSNELCQRASALRSVLAVLPPESLPVVQLLEVMTPRATEPFQGIIPDNLFMFHVATHTSSECFRLPVPSRDFLNQLRACAGPILHASAISIPSRFYALFHRPLFDAPLQAASSSSNRGHSMTYFKHCYLRKMQFSQL